MLTEPLEVIRDGRWENQHKFLYAKKLRDYGEEIFEYLHQKVMLDEQSDVRILIEECKAAGLLPRTRFFFRVFSLNKDNRESYFEELLAQPWIRQRKLLYFDPTQGMLFAARPAGPYQDYLEFSELSKVAYALPRTSLMFYQPSRAPGISRDGTPTRTFNSHQQIVNRLRLLLEKGDVLRVLYSGSEFYYLLVRNYSSHWDFLPAICKQIGFSCRAG